MLPLGSIVYLEDEIQKLVIVGCQVISDNPDADGQVFTDYMRISYPQGLPIEDMLFFQHENVDRVVVEGYRDEEVRFLEVNQDWKRNLNFSRKVIE